MDSPKEPLKCWDCGEAHLQRKCPHLKPSYKNSVYNLQEASTVGDIGRRIHRINVALDGKQVDHQSTIVEIEGKIHNSKVSILIDQGDNLLYVTPTLVESNKLKKVKHTKYWLVQLAIGTKRKVTELNFYCDMNISDQDTKINLKVLPLESYDILIRMDWLEKHKVVLNCYEKSFVYKDENRISRTVQGISKPVSIRQISAMQFKNSISKGCKI